MLFQVLGWNTVLEHLAETVFVGMKGFPTLVGDAEDCTGKTADTALVHLQIARLLENGDLGTEVSTCAASNLAQIHEVGALEAVEGHHNLQSQLAVQQRIDDWELEITHRFFFLKLKGS